MAQLSSPGVSVSVIDESFYTPAAPGTVPLIVVATQENKQNGSSTGTASGTLQANAGKVFLLTSQKDLSDTFGTPVFKTDSSNNPIHGAEQNEYGLQAAYSFLGVSNRAYVVRADIDLGQLNAKADAPAGAPADGQYWFDTSNSKFGIFQWNSSLATTASGQTFANRLPTVITDSSKLQISGAPLSSIGAVGDYALTAKGNLYSLWFKKTTTSTQAGQWVEVGSTEWTASWPTVQGVTPGTALQPGMTLTINNGSSHNITGHSTLDTVVTDINDTLGAAGVTAAVINGHLEIYSTGASLTVSGTALAACGLTAGTYLAPKLQVSPHYQVPTFKRTENATTVQGYPTGSIWIKTTEPNLGARWMVKLYNAATKGWNEVSAPIYENNVSALAGLDVTGGGINLARGTLYVKSNVNGVYNSTLSPAVADFKIFARRAGGATTVTSGTTVTFVNATNTFTISESVPGINAVSNPITVSFNGTVENLLTNLSQALAGATYGTSHTPFTSKITASVNTSGQVTFTHALGGDIYFVDGTNNPIAALFTPYAPNGNAYTGTVNFYTSDSADYDYVASLWSPYGDITAGSVAPTTVAADGQLWYSSIVSDADILVHNGVTWVGYQFHGNGSTTFDSPFYNAGTDPEGPIVSAVQPKAQSGGGTLVTGDLWIDTSDLEHYPKLYRYSQDFQKWVLVDTSDQTTQDGILFADARWSGAGDNVNPDSIKSLLTSNFLDPDAPDPALYPKGMLLWNTRRSGYNVKKFVRNYIDTTKNNHRYGEQPMGGFGLIGDPGYVPAYYPHRWVTVSANQADGSGTFGRKAQRKVIIQALQALVNNNQQIRDEESRVFNLIACPGYPELIGELVALNADRGLTAFVVGDTPARLTPDATTLSNWGNNLAGAVEDNDQGLVSSDEYLGVFYPWGYTSDNLGNNIVVPPSHMILRTIALNDQVSYPWFAPAGTRRGGITNATAVGYIDAAGEFQSVALNTGQRDTLASIKVNPITFITGTGLVNYGQYTRAKNASSLDRINVARLVVYLRRQFAQLAKPYVFEPNDKITRDELKGAAESLLLELVGQRALYDYVVVCDTTNNTPARIDRNELYLDVAIEPVKSVEFIYIPLRLKNTGEIAASAGR